MERTDNFNNYRWGAEHRVHDGAYSQIEDRYLMRNRMLQLKGEGNEPSFLVGPVLIYKTPKTGGLT